MKLIRAFLHRLAGLFRSRDAELAAEIESHLHLHIDDNLRAGMTPEQARREALLKLGGVQPTLEAYRDRATVPVFDHLAHDLRFALRQLRKNPAFAATAILMLALGMCASVSIFALVDGALIKPLPYHDPARLAGVYETHPPMFARSNLSYLDYLDWKRLNKVFTALEVYHNTGFIVTTAQGARPARAAAVSAGFFRVLGVTPLLGRDFHPGEDLAGAPHTAMLSYATWRDQYSANRAVVGTTVTLDGTPYAIVGVLPNGFHFAPTGPAAYYVALHPSSQCEQRRSCHNLFGLARLRDGVSFEAALADCALIARRLEQQYPGSNRGQGASLLPLTEVIVGDIRPILLVLLSAAALLLLIACVNIVSLLLVRSESRRREMAVRGALGASRARLVSQFMTEGLVLVAVGGAIGLSSAGWVMRLLTSLIPAEMLLGMPFLQGLGLSLRVIGFSAAVALLAALLFALTPSLHLSFSRMREGLADAARGSAGTAWARVGSKLVVLELAIATVLLVGAGLLGQSLFRLLHVYLGFQPDHLAVITAVAPDGSYGKDPQAVALLNLILDRLRALPGVRGAGSGSLLPVSYNGNTDWIRFVGKAYGGEHNEVNERDISADYLRTIGARLVSGRYFSDADDQSKPRVAIINQTLARKYYPGEDPIGKQYGDLALTPKSLKTIVGVVGDVREGALDADIWPAEYLPLSQNPSIYLPLVARTAQSPESVLPAMAAAIRQIDPTIVTFQPTTMDDQIGESQSAYFHRSAAWLVSGFAALALVLGLIGLYGVIAYSVSQRTREIGVRMALGAQPGSVYALILTEAGRLTAAGIMAGLAGALALTSLMRKLLFGVESWDLPTLAAVAMVLASAALLASYFPARRAASVNPVDALRAE